MKISVHDLSFGYADVSAYPRVFGGLSAEFDFGDGPLVILGPSGSGKTTLLKLLGGLLKPDRGEVVFSGGRSGAEEAPKTAFMFQEPRLLSWMTVLGNVSLPLEKGFGRKEARRRATRFLSLVSLEGKQGAYPRELSGGEVCRVSMARAFAWPADALFMDEPFQSLDIPLRISLMDLTLSLLETEKRALVVVTHDPREAIYIGRRIVILGTGGEGIDYDRAISLPWEDRAYGSAVSGQLERELIGFLSKKGRQSLTGHNSGLPHG
jgi:NitT/TauT family transport system ATP-binding protein